MFSNSNNSKFCTVRKFPAIRYMGLKPDPKTIYGIQHSGTGKPDPKTIILCGIETGPKDHILGFNAVGTGKPEGKPDPKTNYIKLY